MELSFEDVEKYLEQIFTQNKIIDVDSKTLIFKFPGVFVRAKAKYFYDREYKRSLEEGLLSNEGMKKVLETRNLITAEDKQTLISLKNKLAAQKLLLAKTTKVKANQDRIKVIIHDLEDKIRQIELKERSKLSMTAENKAEESKLLFLCWASTFEFYSDKLLWPEFDIFLQEHSIEFRLRVMSEFMLFYSGISTSIIRTIARSGLWRIRYVTSLKTSEPLFGVPTSEYTNDMLNLAYWSHYYQNIYEMLPDSQPPEHIIEDDEALDAYMHDYYEEQKRDNVSRRSRKSPGRMISAFDAQEVIVTRSNELYEDIEYDTPKESQAIKDRVLIKKKAGGHSSH